MHQAKKDNEWHFGMKAHIGVDVDTGPVYSFTGTSANVHDITQTEHLLHGKETDVFADAVYRGIEERSSVTTNWNIVIRTVKRKQLTQRRSDRILETIEQLKASVRDKFEHPFRVIKRQFGFTKVRSVGLPKTPLTYMRCLLSPIFGWQGDIFRS